MLTTIDVLQIESDSACIRRQEGAAAIVLAYDRTMMKPESGRVP